MIAEGITASDVADLAWERLNDNKAAQTSLALRETLAAIGHREGVLLDEISESRDFYRAYIGGVATAPIDRDAKVYILNETAEVMDAHITLRSGKSKVLKYIGRVTSRALSRADFQGGSYEFYGEMVELGFACRREIPRMPLLKKIGYLLVEPVAVPEEKLEMIHSYVNHLMELHARPAEETWNMFNNPLQTP